MRRIDALAIATLTFVFACRAGDAPPGVAMPARIRGGWNITPDHRIGRGVQARIAGSALQTIERAAPDVLASMLHGGIAVPRTEQSVNQGWSNCTMVMCPQGCTIPVTLATQRPVEIRLEPPDQATAVVRIAIPLTSLPIEGCNVAMSINIDTSRGARPEVGLQTRGSLRMDTHAERASYLRIEVADFEEAPGEEIEDADFVCRAGGLGRMLCGVVNAFLRDTIRDRIREQLASATAPLRDLLAEPSNDPPGCPRGTHADGAHCTYGDGTTVPVLLGIDGELGPQGAGSTSSPVTRFLVAAGDPFGGIVVTPGSIFLDAFVGAEASAHSPCVPTVAPPSVPILPEIAALRAGPARAGSDVTVAVSQAVIDSTLYALWNGGSLCSERDAAPSHDLGSAFVAALPAGSPLRALLPNGSVTVAVHPQRPPHIVLAEAATAHAAPFTIEAPSVDLEVSTGGPTAFTVHTDVRVPFELSGGMVRPAGSGATFANTTVTGTSLTPDQSVAAVRLVAASGPELTRRIAALIPSTLPPIAAPVPGATARTPATFQLAPTPDGLSVLSDSNARFLSLDATIRYQPAAP